MFIGAEKLSYTYMPKTPFATEALSGVSFSLRQGEFALLIGPSGSGKSTLIQHLNGLLSPSAGKVIFEGRDVGAAKGELLALRRRVGLVFQMAEEHFFSETVYDEVAFAPRNLGLEEEEVKEKVKTAIEKVGLCWKEVHERHPFQLSAGQKRLVALAAVLSPEPEVLILDEPTAGLDPAGRCALYELLKNLNRQGGHTVLVCTHFLDEVAALAESVLVLENGKVAMNGAAEDIFAERDRLAALGLELPEISEIMYCLASGGLPVRTNIYTLQEAREEINSLEEGRLKK